MEKENKGKSKYWTFEVYPEMFEKFENEGDEIIQVPYAWCKHDKDVKEVSKELGSNGVVQYKQAHIHVLVAYPASTTYKNMMDIACKLGAKHIERVKSVNYLYEYLIHNTEDAKKKGKYQYSQEDRHSCNGFDIEDYKKVSGKDSIAYRLGLINIIKKNDIRYFDEFVSVVLESGDVQLIETLFSYHSFYSSFIKSYDYRKNKEEEEEKTKVQKEKEEEYKQARRKNLVNLSKTIVNNK